MLIKAYTASETLPASDLVIIENVSDVFIHAGCYRSIETGPIDNGPYRPSTWKEIDSVGPDLLGRLIDYTDNKGVRTRLRINNYAYVCNDEGRTIEKVNA